MLGSSGRKKKRGSPYFTYPTSLSYMLECEQRTSIDSSRPDSNVPLMVIILCDFILSFVQRQQVETFPGYSELQAAVGSASFSVTRQRLADLNPRAVSEGEVRQILISEQATSCTAWALLQSVLESCSGAEDILSSSFNTPRGRGSEAFGSPKGKGSLKLSRTRSVIVEDDGIIPQIVVNALFREHELRWITPKWNSSPRDDWLTSVGIWLGAQGGETEHRRRLYLFRAFEVLEDFRRGEAVRYATIRRMFKTIHDRVRAIPHADGQYRTEPKVLEALVVLMRFFNVALFGSHSGQHMEPGLMQEMRESRWQFFFAASLFFNNMFVDQSPHPGNPRFDDEKKEEDGNPQSVGAQTPVSLKGAKIFRLQDVGEVGSSHSPTEELQTREERCGAIDTTQPQELVSRPEEQQQKPSGKEERKVSFGGRLPVGAQCLSSMVASTSPSEDDASAFSDSAFSDPPGTKPLVRGPGAAPAAAAPISSSPVTLETFALLQQVAAEVVAMRKKLQRNSMALSRFGGQVRTLDSEVEAEFVRVREQMAVLGSDVVRAVQQNHSTQASTRKPREHDEASGPSLRTEFNRQQTEVAAALRTLQGLQTEVRGVTERIGVVETATGAAINLAERQGESGTMELRAELEKLRQELARERALREHEANRARDEIVGLTTAVRASAAALEALQAEVSEIRESRRREQLDAQVTIGELRGEVSDHRQELAEIRRMQDSEDASHSVDAADLRTVKQEVELLRRRIDARRYDLSLETSPRLTALPGEVSSVKQGIASNQSSRLDILRTDFFTDKAGLDSVADFPGYPALGGKSALQRYLSSN